MTYIAVILFASGYIAEASGQSISAVCQQQLYLAAVHGQPVQTITMRVDPRWPLSRESAFWRCS